MKEEEKDKNEKMKGRSYKMTQVEYIMQYF
jgi:hypothetical protein